MQGKLNEVQKIINGYFDSVDSEAFGRFRADFSFGKMLRSKLLLTIAPNSPIAPKVCAIIELIHFASLLHDDVIDSANLRRGKQSINAKYGDKNAIMLGDILYSKAFYEIACVSCGGANLAQIISNAVFELSLGELDDVFLGESINLDAQKYLKMVERKTGALIEASAICGGVLKNENSSLGAPFALGENFGEQQTASLVLSPKFSPNTKSPPQILELDSNKGDSTESKNGESANLPKKTIEGIAVEVAEFLPNFECETGLGVREHSKFGKSMQDAPKSKLNSDKYRIYGRNLGIAFQIIDDLLDITQEDSTLGKESFSDFKEGKTTLPYIYLYNALNANDKEILKSYFKKPLDSAQKGWIRNKMSEFGIIEQVKNVALGYGKMALSVLDSSDESDKNLLKIIADMIDREF